MKINRIMVMSASALAFTLAAGAPAMAFRAQETTLRSVRSTIQDLKEITRDSHRALIQALRLASGESSSYADKTIEAQKRLMDAQQQNDSTRARQMIRAEAESGKFDVDPNACLIVDMFLNQDAGTASEGQGSRVGGDVMRQVTGGSPAVREGGPAAAREVMDSVTPLSLDGMEIADGSVDLRYWVNSSTLDLENEEVAQAYTAALRNLVSPIPDRPVTAQEMNESTESVVRAAVQQGVNSRRSIAINAIAMTGNMVEPRADSRPFMDMLEEASVTYNRPTRGRISELGQIEAYILATYASPNPKSSNPTIVLQEIRRQLEISNRMQYISLELQMRQANVQAAQLLEAVDN